MINISRVSPWRHRRAQRCGRFENEVNNCYTCLPYWNNACMGQHFVTSCFLDRQMMNQAIWDLLPFYLQNSSVGPINIYHKSNKNKAMKNLCLHSLHSSTLTESVHKELQRTIRTPRAIHKCHFTAGQPWALKSQGQVLQLGQSENDSWLLLQPSDLSSRTIMRSELTLVDMEYKASINFSDVNKCQSLSLNVAWIYSCMNCYFWLRHVEEFHCCFFF